MRPSPARASPVTHAEALASAIRAAQSCGARAWPRNVGLFADPRGNVRKIGVKGEADAQGIIPPGGWGLAIEVKTYGAVRTKRQVAWGRMWVRMGGCYVVARYSDSDDGDAAVKAAIEGFTAERSAGVVRGAGA